MAAAADCVTRLGYAPAVLAAPVAGEARASALAWWQEARARVDALTGRVAVISSGETTVTVRGQGRGGRNQEFALALVESLNAASWPAALISIGTDGIDGPTDAAGAIVDTSTALRARARGRRSTPRAPTSSATTATRFSPLSAIWCGPVQATPTSATFKCC
jgi:glycerate 2-kinase